MFCYSITETINQGGFIMSEKCPNCDSNMKSNHVKIAINMIAINDLIYFTQIPVWGISARDFSDMMISRYGILNPNAIAKNTAIFNMSLPSIAPASAVPISGAVHGIDNMVRITPLVKSDA